MKTNEYYHLLRRAGFGASLENTNVKNISRKQAVNQLFSQHSKNIPLTIDYPKINAGQLRNMTATQRKELQKLNRDKLIEYNIAWLSRMAETSNYFLERMVYFWSGLFIVSSKNIRFTEQYHNTIRQNALGNFNDLLNAIAKEASMLNYLDNNKNKKQSPNENFARELMELFTLGRDVLYTEEDVKEAARAFTGWRFNAEGKFIEAKRQHDEGQKVFLGHRGNFNGDDIIRIILEQKECAQYICSRIYQHFVNDNIDEQHVNELASVFYPSYNITEVMQHLFTASWFYNNENCLSKIKSPIELMVGLNRLIPFTINNPKSLLAMQKIMGQVLLQAPNVAGWPGGREWIDSNTLMFRLRLPSLLFNGGQIETESTMEENEMMRQRRKNYLKASVRWDELNQSLLRLDVDILHYLTIGKQPDDQTREIVRDTEKQNYLLKLISLPEYQMC